VIVPDDAKIIIEQNYFLTDKIILKNRLSIKNLDMWDDYEFCKKLVKTDPCNIRYVKNKSHEICKLAVESNAYAIDYLNQKCQTDEICMLAIKTYLNSFVNIRNKTLELCNYVLVRDGLLLRYIKNQTEEMCELAIKNNPSAFEFVKNKTPKLCNMAISKDGNLIRFVKIQTQEICQIAVRQNKDSIQFVNKKYKYVRFDTNLQNNINPSKNILIWNYILLALINIFVLLKTNKTELLDILIIWNMLNVCIDNTIKININKIKHTLKLLLWNTIWFTLINWCLLQKITELPILLLNIFYIKNFC
jgi:hypothetical protein